MVAYRLTKDVHFLLPVGMVSAFWQSSKLAPLGVVVVPRTIDVASHINKATQVIKCGRCLSEQRNARQRSTLELLLGFCKLSCARDPLSSTQKWVLDLWRVGVRLVPMSRIESFRKQKVNRQHGLSHGSHRANQMEHRSKLASHYLQRNGGQE